MTLVPHNHPILNKPSQAVSQDMLDNNGAALKPIASLLVDQINRHAALGISASQIGIDLAVFAISVDGQYRICANPQIVAASADMEKADEGCLSFPNLFIKVNRPCAVVVRYHNEHGKEVTEQLDGLTARAWLHEYDHTIGICFTNRVSKLSLAIAKRKLNKQNRRASI